MNSCSATGASQRTLIKVPAQRSSEAVSAVSLAVHRSGAWTVVEIEGEMDREVVARVVEVIGRDTNRVVYDLHAVTFLDASGLGLLVRVRREALERGGSVRLVAPSRSARRVLTVTGLDRAFRTFDSIDEAVSIQIDRC